MFYENKLRTHALSTLNNGKPVAEWADFCKLKQRRWEGILIAGFLCFSLVLGLDNYLTFYLSDFVMANISKPT